MQYPDYIEPSSKRVVAGMPRQEALFWLRGVKSAIMGLGSTAGEWQERKRKPKEEEHEDAQLKLRVDLTAHLFVEEYIVALDQYLDDPELCELAMFIAFSLVAEDGAFNGPVPFFGYGHRLLEGPTATTGINARDHFVARLKEMPEAEGILGRVAGAYGKKVKQRKKNLSLNKRLAAEACAIARAGGFSPRECRGTKPARYSKPKPAARMTVAEAHERHRECVGLAEQMYAEGTGIPARCVELAQVNQVSQHEL